MMKPSLYILQEEKAINMARNKQNIVAYCYSKNGTLLSKAKNSFTKSHPLQAYFAIKVGLPAKIYLHAEIAAILKAKDKPIHKIKIERINRKGTLLPSSPCPICLAAINAFRIKETIFCP